MHIIEKPRDIAESLAPSMKTFAGGLGSRSLELLDIRLPRHDAVDLVPETKRETNGKMKKGGGGKKKAKSSRMVPWAHNLATLGFMPGTQTGSRRIMRLLPRHMRRTARRKTLIEKGC